MSDVNRKGTVVDRWDDKDAHADDAEIEHVLRAAFRAKASRAVSDFTVVPAMTGPYDGERRSRRRHVYWIAPLAAAVVVAAVVAAVVWLPRGPHRTDAGRLGLPTQQQTSAATTTSAGASQSSTPSAHPTSHKPSGPPAKVVRVTSDLSDGDKVGVGEPIVLNFSPSPTNSAAFTKAVTVTVNGRPANGAWYWEKPYADEPIQAHYREPGYWPANSTIQVKLPIRGLSAGRGLVYSGALTSVTFSTGDKHVSTVDGSTLRMTVTSNGQVVRTVPVSLGAASTPTFNGIKVVMQKGEDVPGTNTLRPSGTVMMSGPGYTNDPVPWSVRVTASGEYVHAAGWNTHIGVRSTSNGCTNLKPADGQWFYGFSQLGDVVQYVNISDGSPMNPLDGLGDWNIPWGSWSLGGQLINH